MAIEKIYCNPPLAIARLGRSHQPVDAYLWAAGNNPHITGETQITPAWTLDVQPDGSVKPRMPSKIRFRDVQGVRPVAPYIEIWCVLTGDSSPHPLTEKILNDEDLELQDLSFTIEAVNRKAARRTLNNDLAYGTFPALVVRGDDHQVHSVDAVSPRSVDPQQRMIPDTRPIKFGSFQAIRPTPPTAPRSLDWPDSLNLNTIRVRFTPGRGEFYGPAGHQTDSVSKDNAILNDGAGWFGARRENTSAQPRIYGIVEPSDTFAGAENDSSLGIIDDTCDVRLNVKLSIGQGRDEFLTASANIFSGPPDFSPDSRPFVSLSDALLDRDRDAEALNEAMTSDEKDKWVEDLFERAYEHVSLMNVDHWRYRLAGGRILRPEERRQEPIENDKTSFEDRPMGALDALRDGAIALSEETQQNPLPITERARERHRYLSDLYTLKNLVNRDPDRIKDIIRKPFQESEDGFTMKMPPFMRGSNGAPLTLSVAQYGLLMAWVEEVTVQQPLVQPSLLASAANISESAARAIADRARIRRENILAEASDEPM
ncbi:hypothetical protein WOB72_03380 [Vibrio parahaemolyticus]